MTDEIYTASKNAGTGIARLNDKPELSFFADGIEKLRISEDGFFVDGKTVPVDDDHGAKVYQAFKDWMSIAAREVQPKPQPKDK